ncbi:MAG: hypothetical protein D6786_02945 [Gammaproteobacteria bacterium]|nr:MAG: hypothetical protein D6786_02945 [Gammaproteobacteria bacterium]
MTPIDAPTPDLPEIPSPAGYGQLVLLDRHLHRELGVSQRAVRQFQARLSSIFLTAQELSRAARFFPIAFVRNPGTEGFLPMAITGLVQGENLILDASGEWPSGIYKPAYVRRFPFCTVRIRNEEQPAQPPQVVVAVQEDALSRDAQPPLFDGEGVPNAAWHEYESLIHEMETAVEETRTFCHNLARLDLLEPFEAHVQPKDLKALSVKGLHRVNESRLNALTGNAVKKLMKDGQLSRIYAHLLSLDNFDRLLDGYRRRKMTH